MERVMEKERQAYRWWFDSHNSAKCSPWLESILSELNEKTKTMLTLVEADADSFAQRAEMYYKKRPELISMVEDFYRTHRSLAERYDQLRGDRSVRVRSPLRSSMSLPKDEYVSVLNSDSSLKSFDSFTEVAYNSDAESEVDDPVREDDLYVNKLDWENEKPVSRWANFDELCKLREQLDRLQKENQIQKHQIEQNEQEKEQLVRQLSGNINELHNLREEIEALKQQNSSLVKETSELKVETSVRKEQVVKVTARCKEEEELASTNMKDEIEYLKLQNMKLMELVQQKEEEPLKVMKKLQQAEYELMMLSQETQLENEYVHDTLMLKDRQFKHEEMLNLEVTRQLEETNSVLMNLSEEFQIEKSNLIIGLERKEQQLKCEMEGRTKLMREFEETKNELMNLREEMLNKETQLHETLKEKDEDKRAVIRELSLAMEILREDNQYLKKSIVKESPGKRGPSDFQFCQGIQLKKLFNLSPRRSARSIALV